MNRFKKEERRKREEARRGLSKEQVAALDQADLRKAKIEELARQIHVEKFSEEYDYTFDSYVELQERKKGINPMRQEYIEKVRAKREALGVSQLSRSGESISSDTLDLCMKEAESQIDSEVD